MTQRFNSGNCLLVLTCCTEGFASTNAGVNPLRVTWESSLGASAALASGGIEHVVQPLARVRRLGGEEPRLRRQAC